MALLNFANTYAEISNNFNLNDNVSSPDYVKLFFSKDGHIITHGKDFLCTFTEGARGLVPTCAGEDSDKSKKILRGNATWAAITTDDLPILADADIANPNTTSLLNSKQIIDYINASFSANDAMRYKGTITKTSDGYTHNTTGTETAGFPTNCEVGDTYRVVGGGIYAGYECTTGDLLICIKDGTGNSLNSNTYWTAVEANIDGEVHNTVNGTSIYTYSSSKNKFDIYAPTTAGAQGLVLLSSGSAAPIWANQDTLKVGLANKVTNALSTGTGLSLGSSGAKYDGSVAKTISLTAATATTIGGVIVDKDSTNKTISVTNTGSIYLTHDNIVNALGYDPISKNTWRPITINGDSIGDKTLNFIPSGDVYLKVDSNNDGIEDISFGLSWYNLSLNGGKGGYETA